MERRLFTSESVTEGHPDKMCDAISDAILDALMEKDPMSRVACETATTTGLVLVMGSIQTEGHFGDIKENEKFRRFNYRSADKVYKEFMLYAIGRNINKYCRFLNEKLKKFEGKTTEKTA